MTNGSAPRPLRLGMTAAAPALAIYALTLAPSIGFTDSGELAAAAHGFGVAHPTGYPLFVGLAGVWASVPIASVILRLNALSALATAAAVGVCVDLVFRLLGRGAAFGVRQRAAGAVCAGLFLAFNRTVWSNALTVEVYALHALLLVAILDSVVRALENADAPDAARAWRWPALLTGLSFSNHLTTVQLLPALALAWHSGRPNGEARRRLLPVLGALFAVGLVPYLFLPLRSAQDPAMNWGEPHTIQALLDHVGAREYRGRFLMGREPFLRSLREFVSGLPHQSGALTLVLAAIGLPAAWRRDPIGARVLLASLLASVAVATNYAIPDIASYFVLAYLVLAILGGYGVAQLYSWLLPRRGFVATAFAAASVSMLLLGSRDASERGNFLVEDFARNMFRSLAPRAVVISYQWDHWVSPALYLQRVEGLRPDVLVIDKRLCQRAWYVRQLARRNPELRRGAGSQLAALLEAADARDRGVDRELFARIDAFLQALVDANFETRPLYTTLDVEDAFPSGYRQVPEGLALRLYRPGQLPSPDAPVWDDFHYRPFARRDGWTDRLRQYYGLMLLGRGAFLEEARRAPAAARYYERALAFEPSRNARAEILARLERVRRAARAP